MSEPSGTPLYRRRVLWTAGFGLATGLGFLLFLYRYLDDVARGHDGTALARFIEELSAAYASVPLIVLLVVLAYRVPIDRPGWPWHVPVHLAALVAGAFTHTTLMFLSRSLLFPLVGLGPYDYGLLRVRYFMELPVQAIGYGIVLASVTLFRSYQTLRDREERAAQLERSLSQSQLQNLRLQLQPHFLFNALNAISEKMYDDPVAADAMIGRLSDLLRLSLRTAQTQEVPLREELAVIDHYVTLMKARFGDALNVRTGIAPGLDDALVPSLILQPLVENAVRHGGLATKGRGTIDVRASRAGSRLRLEVADDGSAADGRIAAGGNGMGLRITAERLRLLYGEAHRFQAGPVDGAGFQVVIEVPWRQDNGNAEWGMGRLTLVIPNTDRLPITNSLRYS